MKTIVTPAPLSSGDQVAEPIDVAARESRGRFIKQDQARLAVNGAGDLDFLLHSEIEAADLGIEVDIESERSKMFAQRGGRRPTADQADRPHWSIGQEHVVQDGQVPDQRHFLERRLNAESVGHARRAQARRVAEDLYAASIRQDQSGEQLDDRGFAGAVLAEQRVHASLRDRERDVVDCDGRAEGLAQIDDGHCRVAGRLRHIRTLHLLWCRRGLERQVLRRRRLRPRLKAGISVQAGRRAPRPSRFRASVRRRSRRTSPDWRRSTA